MPATALHGAEVARESVESRAFAGSALRMIRPSFPPSSQMPRASARMTVGEFLFVARVRTA
jgi:hypothetical protein